MFESRYGSLVAVKTKGNKIMSATLMPEVNMEILKTVLTDTEMEIAMGVVAKRDGVYRLRASKPAKGNGSQQYVWRMVAFVASPVYQHHCMPIGADFYLNDSDYAHRPEQYIPRSESESDRETVSKWNQKTWDMMHRGEKKRQYIKQELEPIVDKILETIPKTQWRGAQRWAKAFYG